MGFFDELKKIISGNDLHDQPDSYASNPPQQIRDDEYFEAEGWTTLDKGQIWQKGRLFRFAERTSPARKMIMRYGPHALRSGGLRPGRPRECGAAFLGRHSVPARAARPEPE